jgi:hypothetical protein
VSAGVRSLDGRPDGHSGDVRQCLRSDSARSARAVGMADPAGRRPCPPAWKRAVACGGSGSGPVSGYTLAKSATAAAGATLCPCGGRQTGGGQTPVQGVRPPRTPAWPPSPACPHIAGHLPSGRRSFRKQRTVNRRSLRLVTTSSTLPQGRPAGGRLRRPSSADRDHRRQPGGARPRLLLHGYSHAVTHQHLSAVSADHAKDDVELKARWTWRGRHSLEMRCTRSTC